MSKPTLKEYETNISFRVRQADRFRLRALASKLDKPASEIIRDLIEREYMYRIGFDALPQTEPADAEPSR